MKKGICHVVELGLSFFKWRSFRATGALLNWLLRAIEARINSRYNAFYIK